MYLNNQVTFIEPLKNIKTGSYNLNHYLDENVTFEDVPEDHYILQLMVAESSYFMLLNKGWKPEEAGEVLPNSTKTELMMTGFIDDWEHLFSTEDNEKVKELISGLEQEFIKINY